MSHRSSFVALVCLSLASMAALGCTVTGRTGDSGTGTGSDGGGGANDAFAPAGSIVVMPADYEATINGAPVEIDYQAFRVESDGTMTDVSSTAIFSAASLGTFAGAHFTSGTDRGGRTTIQATSGGRTGNTTLTLHLERDIVESGAPADAPTHFGGTADPANAPSIVYPDDSVMIPPNLEHFELHFMPNGSSLFRLDVMTGPVLLHLYFDCMEPVGGGCVFTPSHETWGAISDAARGLGPVTYTLTGTDSAGRVGTSEPRTIQVANEDITGGVYYWNAGGGAIMRYEFGVPGALEERFLGVAETGTGTMCVGCHTVSRDGTRIAVGTGIPTTTFQVFDVASRTRLLRRPAGGAAFPSQPAFCSFSPDASQLVVSGPHGLGLMNQTDGTITAMITSSNSSMPDWSPDGNHMVYVQVPGAGIGSIDAPAVTSGTIARLDFDGTNWALGPSLADAAGGNNYHPTYSPDGEWVVYNRSPSNIGSMGAGDSSGGSSDCVTDAEMWVVSSSGGGAAMQLDIGPVDRPTDGVCASWPKFDPTTYMDHGQPLFWVAWATARGYGLRYGDGSIMQIWMAAFDPARAAAGQPATHRAFRLPFQNIASGNHIAQWVTHVERMTCSSNADCGGEFCVDGRCYEQAPVF